MPRDASFQSRVFPVYERISALGLPIFLHYAPLMVIGGNDRLKQFQLGNLIGNAVERQSPPHILSLGAYSIRFPRSKYVCHTRAVCFRF